MAITDTLYNGACAKDGATDSRSIGRAHKELLLLEALIGHLASAWRLLDETTSERDYPAHWTDTSTAIGEAIKEARAYRTEIRLDLFERQG
jgi:hypothetical protein